jgi:hypothetical protein
MKKYKGAEKLSFSATALINGLAAVIVQVIFIITLFSFFHAIWVTKGLTAADYKNLMVTAIIVSSIVTAFIVVVVEQVMEKTFLSMRKEAKSLEMNRAMYWGAIGILLVGLAKAFMQGRADLVVGMLVLIALLTFFGRYHKKFREAREGIWFPHTVFHYGLQQLLLYPLGLWLVIYLVKF